MYGQTVDYGLWTVDLINNNRSKGSKKERSNQMSYNVVKEKSYILITNNPWTMVCGLSTILLQMTEAGRKDKGEK
jgi:hypothetical protein